MAMVIDSPTGAPAADLPAAVPCAKQADAGLDMLLGAVVNRRQAMRDELSTRPVMAARQLVARERLLTSLEAYVAALAVRGLSAPPLLRDELALQRSLAPRRP